MTSNETGRRKHTEGVKRRVESLFPQIEYLSYDTFKILAESENAPLLMDVREREEIEIGTIANAQDAKTVHQEILTNGNMSKRVICFCTVGLRSGLKATKLKADGHEVWNYSLVEHLWAGGSLVRPDGALWDRRVHGYQARYNDLMPPDLNTVTFSTGTAILRALPMIPGILTAAVDRGRWSVNSSKKV